MFYKLKLLNVDENKVALWHRRLRHAPRQCLRNISFLIFQMNPGSILRCDACQLSKNKRLVYSININKRSTPSFDLIHSDVWYATIPSIYGHQYFVTLIDDVTRVTWVYLLKSKDEVFHTFQTYHKMIKVKFDKQIKAFRSDNSGEYTSNVFQSYLAENEIESQSTDLLCIYPREEWYCRP